MFGSSIVGVAIGMIFFFLLISIITTTLQEFIASWLNLRGRNLVLALNELIKNNAIRDKFFEQPQIYPLFVGDADGNGIVQRIKDVLTIPFTLRLFRPGGKRPPRMPSYLDASSFAKGVMGAVGTPPLPPTWTVQKEGAAPVLIASLMAQSNPPDPAQIQKELEELYNATINRASGWYKRQADWMALLIGLVTAVSFNADAIHVGRQLWKDTELRESIAKAAEDFVAANDAKFQESCVTSPQEAQPNDKDDNGSNNCDTLFSNLNISLDKVASVGYPIGWKNNQFLSLRDGQSPITAFIGILITALAVSLGNNFWFDLLSKFIRFRGTGKKEDATT